MHVNKEQRGDVLGLQGRPNPQHNPQQALQLPSPSLRDGSLYDCWAAIFSTAAAAQRASKAWALPALQASCVPLLTPGLTHLIA